MADIVIRPMRISDARPMATIERQCFSTPWPAQFFREELENNVCARYLVAARGREIIGYGGIWMMVGHCHLTNLAVVPAERRRGLARQILGALMALAFDEVEIRSMSLEVRRSNAAAQNLYLSMGFTVNHVMVRYYEDNGEDALLMTCDDITRWMKP